MILTPLSCDSDHLFQGKPLVKAVAFNWQGLPDCPLYLDQSSFHLGTRRPHSTHRRGSATKNCNAWRSHAIHLYSPNYGWYRPVRELATVHFSMRRPLRWTLFALVLLLLG